MTYSLKCGCVKAHTCDAVVKRGEVARGAILRACVDHGGPGPDVGIPAASRLRYAAGRRVTVPRTVRTARDLLRRHLREEGREMRALAGPWNVKPETVKTIFQHSRPLAPQLIDAAIEFFKLDEFDALELRLQGAIEAGWQIAAVKEKAQP